MLIGLIDKRYSIYLTLFQGTPILMHIPEKKAYLCQPLWSLVVCIVGILNGGFSNMWVAGMGPFICIKEVANFWNIALVLQFLTII